MPDQPTRPVEEQLHAWAQRRRDQAGPTFELDPIRRHQLHEEVARTASAGAPPDTSRIPLWRRLLPRLALAGGLALVLIAAIARFTSGPGPREGMDLALQRDSESAAPAPTLRSAEGVDQLQETQAAAQDTGATPVKLQAAPSAQDSAVRSEEAQANQFVRDSDAPDRAASRGLEVPSPDSPPSSPATPQAPAELLRQRYGSSPPTARWKAAGPESAASVGAAPAASVAPGELRKDESSARYAEERSATLAVRSPTPSAAPRLTPPPAPPAVASMPSAAAPPVQLEADAPAPEFIAVLSPTRRYRASFGAPPATVLQTFRFEQTGPHVRLSDADGSVYEGRLVDISQEDRLLWVGVPLAAPTSSVGVPARVQMPAGSATTEDRFFQVAGTNKTLNALVTFRGLVHTGATVLVQGQATVGTRTRLIIDAAGAAER